MSSLTRVYISNSKISNNSAVIEGKDAEHLVKVMRLRVGDAFCICDGVSREYDAVLTHISELYVEAALGECREPGTEPYCPITLYQCLPKGDKMEIVIQKAVELGATDIVPVLSDRCISRPDQKSLKKKLERWQRISEAASAQCGRCRIPTIHQDISFENACREMQGKTSFVCYEGVADMHISRLLRDVSQKRSDGISFLIGPEGGIADREIELARAMGIKTVSLGDRIMRTETASGFVLAAIEVLTHA